ncbi:ES8L3 protein, partial [Bucorvus abyssinicus]|nr:ES8L3 protein [Bucorvus abyssinicus]
QDDYSTWKTLGMAWNMSRAEYPNSNLVPSYIPVFSDGWLPPPMRQVQHRRGHSDPRTSHHLPQFPHLALNTRPSLSLSPTVHGHRTEGQSQPSVSSPAEGWGRIQPPAGCSCPPPLLPCHPPISRSQLSSQARVLYEFQGRNPQELSIRMGDTVQVLDQRRKWWLVQDSRGQKGYVPSNVLEPLGQGQGDIVSPVGAPPSLPAPNPPPPGRAGKGATPLSLPLVPPLQDSPPNLLPSSSPAEVTAWLKDKGFSRM